MPTPLVRKFKNQVSVLKYCKHGHKNKTKQNKNTNTNTNRQTKLIFRQIKTDSFCIIATDTDTDYC